MAHTNYRFGKVEVRPAERQLLVEGRPTAVGARAFDVLLALIERRDRVVTKDELFELVWPGLVVEDNNLHVQVSTLRKILGPRSVATIPGRGFRFTLSVEDAEPAPVAALPRHDNLPAQLNSFIGRERELAELKALLASSRMVTLTSVGGTGKTRMSLQLAAAVAADYPDGVWLVELAPLAGEWRVPQAVASVLGVKEEAGRPLTEAIVRHVHGKRLLVILDNCEHLVNACAEIAKQLLQAGPRVKILASSREHLNVAGEKSYPVPALATPDSNAGKDTAALARFDAVRLFIDRAVAVQPKFELTARNAQAVADICRRLDGIPLAIELAAARVRGLSAQKIAERLDHCFALLTDGEATALPRQKTLRASIDWSHDLLSAAERSVFRRLAVFAGGFTLEAAEAVCMGGEEDKFDVLDLLTRLVEKSLVELDALGERYRLLEIVRQYAQERLASSGEEREIRTRHMAFYLALAEKARPELVGPHQGAWLARLDHERENFFSALAWCEHAKDGGQLGLKLSRALKLFYIHHGLAEVGYRMTVQALARAGAQERNELRLGALFDAGQLAYFIAHYGDAQVYLEESVAIARELGHKRGIAAVLQPLGMACLGQGDLATARTHLDEALQLAQALGEKRSIAAALNARAQLYRVEGELDRAEPLYEKVLEIARELHDRESIAIGLLNLAMTSIGRERSDRARLMLVEALAIAEEIGSKPAGQSLLEVCAALGALRQSWENAARFYGAAEAQAAKTGLRRDPADEAFLAPLVQKTRSALGTEAFERAESHGRDLPYTTAMSLARGWLDLAVD